MASLSGTPSPISLTDNADISRVNSFSCLCTRRRFFFFFFWNREAGNDAPTQCLIRKKTRPSSPFQPLPSIRAASHINTEPLQRSRGAENEQPPASQPPKTCRRRTSTWRILSSCPALLYKLSGYIQYLPAGGRDDVIWSWMGRRGGSGGVGVSERMKPL